MGIHPCYRIARMILAQIAADERRFREPCPPHEDKLSGVVRKRSALCQQFGHISQVYTVVTGGADAAKLREQICPWCAADINDEPAACFDEFLML